MDVGMRYISALMWVLAAALSLFLTLGNVSSVRFQQFAEVDLLNTDLRQDPFGSGSFSDITRWASFCLSDGLLVRKELQLKQLDLIFGHTPLADMQKKLDEAQEFLHAYLKCNPSDGNAWLAAAMVSNTENNDSDVTIQYLALSKFYSPNSEGAIRSRALILANTAERLRSANRDLFLDAPIELR